MPNGYDDEEPYDDDWDDHYHEEEGSFPPDDFVISDEIQRLINDLAPAKPARKKKRSSARKQPARNPPVHKPYVRKKRNLPEFKVPDASTISRPERLGRLLMRCVTYIELLGQGATMTGGHESRTCMDIILGQVRSRDRPVWVAVKPSMYDGSNDKVREFLSTPVFDGTRRYAIPKTETIDTLLHAGNTYYDILEKYGYYMPFEEAIIKFFVLNENASPEQKYCGILRGGGQVELQDRYSCISHIIDMVHSLESRSFEEMPSVPLVETIPEVIGFINNGMVCAQYQPRYGREYVVPCLQKLIDAAARDVSRHGGVYNLHIQFPFVEHFDEYDWNITSVSGIPMIQEFLNQCSYRQVGDGGYGTNLSKIGRYLLLEAPLQVKSGFLVALSKEYNFRNVHSATDTDTIRVGDGYKSITGVDYLMRTGILLNAIAASEFAPSLTNNMEMCKYEGVDELQPCFARLLNSAQKVWASTRDDDDYGEASRADYAAFAYHLSKNSESRRSFETSILNEDCSVLRGKSLVPLTCMDILINMVSAGEATAEEPLRDYIFNDIVTNNLLSDLACTDERGSGLAINCLDKLVGESHSPSPFSTLKSKGVLFNLPDCTDSQGNRITCIDKMMQRHELWIYSKYRARQLSHLVEATDRKLYGGGKLPVEPRTRLEAERRDLFTLMDNLSNASKEMNVSDVYGFSTMAMDYDIGSMKFHVPVYVTPAFKQVLEDDIMTFSKYSQTDMTGYVEFDATRNNYVRELLKSISDGTPREVLIAPRLLKLYDANRSLISDYSDYGAIGIPQLLSPERLEPVSFNTYECKNLEGKTIPCIHKMVDIVPVMYQMRYGGGYGSPGDEFTSVFSLKDLYNPKLKCGMDSTGKEISCLEHALGIYQKMFSKSSKSGTNLDAYIAVLSNREFPKYADTIVTDPDGKRVSLRELVCRNADLFALAHYLLMKKASSGSNMENIGGDRPRQDHVALNLHAVCSGCNDIKDPLDRRICVDDDCFKAFIPDRDMDCTYTNPVGEHAKYGGYNMSVDRWASDYARDPDFLMNHFKYRGKDDLFGLSGVYEITYDPAKFGIVSDSSRYDYGSIVEHHIFPAIKRSIGTKINHLKLKNGEVVKNVTITDVKLASDVDNDWAIRATLEGMDEGGSPVVFSELIPVSEIFTKGHLLGSDDVRSKTIKYRGVSDAIRRISTSKIVKKTDGKLTMVISNRPADILRASTCQSWTSCMGFRSYPGTGGLNRSLLTKMNMGGYIAYIASDELSPSWIGRMMMTPAFEKPGDESSMFILDKVYGLSQYRPIISAAIGILLRDHGYNDLDSYYKGDHHELHYRDYVFNTGETRGSSTPSGYTRRGGGAGRDGGVGGERYIELMKEINASAMEQCIARVLLGVPTVIAEPGGVDTRLDTEEECKRMFGNSTADMQKYLNSLVASNLISKDLYRAVRDSKYWYHYDGGVVNDAIPESTISDSTLRRFKEQVNVVKVKELSTLSGRGDTQHG